MVKTAFYCETELKKIKEIMIKIDHIAIHVNDLEIVKDFFICFFKAKEIGRAHV